jgi:TolA-binding protein
MIRTITSRLAPLLVIALTAGSLLVLPRSGSAARYTQELEKLNRFVQTSGGSDAEMKIFREGRDLIGDEAWEKAALKFRDYIGKYPKGKDTDAALYWLAFALKKQEKYQDADRTLERLVSEYPRSKWKDDASAMRIELAAMLGNRQTVPISRATMGNKIVALQSLFRVIRSAGQPWPPTF